MILLQRWLLSFLVMILIGQVSRADEPPPPPTIPQRAIDVGIIGIVLPGKVLFHSYDTGLQYVGTGPFPSIWYKFQVGTGDSRAIGINSSFATGPDFGASYTLYDNNLTPLGAFNRNLILTTGTYYIQVTASQQTKFHFGFSGRPAMTFFKNDAGRTEAAALALGTLGLVTQHTNDFYTYYDRQDINPGSASTTPGEMVPNFSSPDPVVQSEFYSFDLGVASPVTVHSISQHDDTYVIYPRGGSPYAVLKGDQTATLQAGSYILEIFDKDTQVSGGGSSLVAFRDPHVENYEHHIFELRIYQVAPSPPSNPNTPEVSPLGPPPTPSCIIIGSQRIGC
jgi:hypothetical protein